MIYTIISPPAEYYSQCEKIFIDPVPEKVVLIIKEYSQGSHEHLNIITDTQSRVDSISRRYRKLLAKISPLLDTPIVVKSKVITNEDGLVGGYLQKEEGHEVLYNQGYNLEELKERYKVTNKIGMKFKWKQRMTEDNAVPLILQFIEDKNIDISNLQCIKTQILKPMFLERIYVGSILEPRKLDKILEQLEYEDIKFASHII